MIVNYSFSRAKKDAQNRQKGLEKLEKLLEKQRLTKKHLNNCGYNKYFKIDGTVKINVDYEKLKANNHLDGLKGFIKNIEISKEEVIESDKRLWQNERAFII